MECRPGCAACCIAPSISSPIPGMELGKPAGVRCVQLDEQDGCRLFGDSRRPRVCGSLQPSIEMCGTSRGEALRWLTQLEQLTTTPPSPDTKTRPHTLFRCDATNMPL
ncbi:YkgJ family cysteine cluster protein [Azoarcus communis]|uniref:YkgJ family cysteine cluster protein n=1 Tax=Parazoarcus communis TaxID=41977 RepID=UPI00145963AD|nr:YkgJ family cysteine cluster protein [Parazoarcus communis]NMG50180.1 YkgJ family cysteine cluster protein [Parazoarcus communis]